MLARSVVGRHMRPERPRTRVIVTASIAMFVVGLAIGAAGGWTVEHHGGARHVLASIGRAAGVAEPATPTAAPIAGAGTGIPATQHATRTSVAANPALYASWAPPADVPSTGVLLEEQIPGTVSHFAARPALVYLPPAALVAHPPALPVVVLLSGQSRDASPDDLELQGHLSTMMDAIASANRGLAPIVVVPDQLETGTNNPMCVDGPLGNSRTYLTRDVPNWIRAHLAVQTAASAWTIGGFSQGGTCAIQLGAGLPNLFRNIIDVSGELGPTLGTVDTTVQKGFRGDFSAYEAAQPGAEMAAHGRYSGEQTYFTAAQLDTVYGPAMPVVSAMAAKAGMSVTTMEIPHARHDWAMASGAIASGLRWLMPRIGLQPPERARLFRRLQ